MHLTLRFAYITALLATTPDGFFCKEIQNSLLKSNVKKNEPLVKKKLQKRINQLENKPII